MKRLLVKGLAEISLAYEMVFDALLDGSSELGQVEIGSIVLKTWSWSPYGAVFGPSNTILLGVGNCLISLTGSSTKSFNFSAVI